MRHHLRDSEDHGNSSRDRGSLTLKAAAGQGALAILLLSPALAESSAQRAAPQETPRISAPERVEVSLVLIDVVVRDRKDRPVAGLTLDDFELRVDNTLLGPDAIESFEEICSALPEEGRDDRKGLAKAPSPAAPDANTRAAPALAPVSPRHIVVYFDFSQMSHPAVSHSLAGARGFLASRLTPDDRVMILAFTKELRVIQEFTSDGALLASRLETLSKDNTILHSDALEEEQALASIARVPSDAKKGQFTGRRAIASTLAFSEQSRARRSLKALEELMPALAGLKGRKALVLFTDALRDEPGVQYLSLAHSSPAAVGITLAADLLQLTREANAAGVSVYTIHAGGLEDTALNLANDSRATNVTLEVPKFGIPQLVPSMGDLSETQDAARAGLASALALQTTLATETGGRALQRTNDLGAILNTARQDLSCYYLIGYRHQGRGDGRRHDIVLTLKPRPDGGSTRGLALRYRPYFTDSSAEDRRLRLLRSALAAPEMFSSIPVMAEAFDLAPEGGGRRVLIKISVPIETLSLLPDGKGGLQGGVRVEGEVISRDDAQEPACAFKQEIPLEIPEAARTSSGRAAPRGLVFETGCLLKPGTYAMTVVALDPATQAIGARRSTISIKPATVGEPSVEEVHLWTRDPGLIVFASGAERIGVGDAQGEARFVPVSRRRMATGQEALLSFLLCLPRDASLPDARGPIQVKRSLLGEGGATVATLKELTLSDPPDPATGCYQVTSGIPGGTLGDGVYTFSVHVDGMSSGRTLAKDVDISVE